MRLSCSRLLGLYQAGYSWSTGFNHKVCTSPLLQSCWSRSDDRMCRRELKNVTPISSLPAYMPTRLKTSICHLEHYNPVPTTQVLDTDEYCIPDHSSPGTHSKRGKNTLPSNVSSPIIFEKLLVYWTEINNEYSLDEVEQYYFSYSDNKDINEKTKLNDKFWEALETDYKEAFHRAVHSFSYGIFFHIEQLNKPELAILYMTYIRRHTVPARVVVTYFIKICAKNFPDLASKEVDGVLNAKTVPSYLYKDLIEGIVKSSNWRKCFQILERMEKDKSKITTSTIITLLQRLLGENEIDTFHLYYMKCVETHQSCFLRETMHEDVFKVWESGKISIQILLEVICSCGIHLDRCQAFKIMNALNVNKEIDGLKLQVEIATVDAKSKRCNTCRRSIPKTDITIEEINQLRKCFLKTFMTADTSGSTFMENPMGLNNFKEFLRNAPKFDVVLDMQNIIVGKGGGTRRFQKIMKQLDGMTKLVVGAEQWLDVEYKDNKCYFYPVVAMDDLYILLGALYAGPKAYFVSNDLFRDHKKNFSQNEQALFIKWQKCRQISHGSFNILYPHNTVPDKHARGWHVPFSDTDDGLQSQKKVLCITKTNTKCDWRNESYGFTDQCRSGSPVAAGQSGSERV